MRRGNTVSTAVAPRNTAEGKLVYAVTTNNKYKYTCHKQLIGWTRHSVTRVGGVTSQLDSGSSAALQEHKGKT